MYLVQTYLDRSDIQGVGVFAGEDIKKGQVVWEFIEGLDVTIDPADIEKYPQRVKEHVLRHAYLYEGKYYLCGDHGQYVNHSDAPNTGGNNLRDSALRDIKKGEELTADYRTFDEVSREKLEF